MFLRYGLVLAGFMVVALALVVPVSAGSGALDYPAFSVLNLTDTTGAIPDASVREMVDSATAGDLITPGPVSAESVSISPTDSLQTAINNAADGDTIYLAPGIYREHDLVILGKNLTLSANETLGGNRENTIIDAEQQGRIFDHRGNSNNGLTLSSLTLRNGYVSGDGGAVNASGDVIILDSAITGSSAGGSGGAVSATGLVGIGSSTISGCTASGNGGASSSFIVQVVQSTITDCSAGGNGGAISSSSASPGFILNSVITGCSAGGNGGAAASDFIVMVYGSTISGCTAGGNGGAVYSGYGGVGISGSVVSGCSADGNGGAISAGGQGFSMSYSTLSGCSAGGSGGAVYTAGQVLYLVYSTISGCSAQGDGGAVYSSVSHPSIQEMSTFIVYTTIADCSAGGSGGALYSLDEDNTLIIMSTFTGNRASVVGGAIWSSSPSTSLNFSRIYGNTAPAVYSFSGPIDAENTWWGSNAEPAGSVGALSGTVDYTPWLVLDITASPRSLLSGTSAMIRTNLTGNSEGADTSAGGYFVPDGIINRFTVSGSGSVLPVTAGTVDGRAGTTFIAGVPGTSRVCGIVDAQTVCIAEEVTYPPATMGPFNDDDSLPGITPAPAADPSTVLPMTVTVNIGGNSAAGKTTVTGTKLSGLVVTGTVQPGPGSNQTTPPGIVYQYISLVPAGYTTISSTVINFTVPQSWLEENGIAPSGVVLCHQTPEGWETLPTSVLYTKDGMVYFSAKSPGFSLFAIAGTPSAAAPVTTVMTPVALSTPALEPGPVRTTVTQAPVVSETTEAPPAAEAPAGSQGFPVVPALIGICGVGLLGGGIAARRWWLRRQNPALFAEYD